MLKILFPLVAAGLAVAATAHAEPQRFGENPDRVTVSVKDVDFHNPQQVGALYATLQKTSHIVCDTTEADEPFRTADDRACEREAVQGAVHDLNQPLLNAMAADREDLARNDDRRHRGY